MVGVVFKVLAISLVLMFMMNVSIVVIDTLTVYNRVQSLMGILQKEVVNNNCLRDGAKQYMKDKLESIKKGSDVVKDFETNFDSQLVVDGVTYDSIGESNVKNYGETLDIVIKINFSANVFFPYQKGTDSGMVRSTTVNYSLTMKDTVPALRYLK